MFKTLILDFDEKNMTGIKYYIQNNFPKFKVERTFTTEKEFLKYIKSHNVNLVIMEIKFLGASFIKKMEEIAKTFPDIKFITYGTLADINYLKKSLEVGALSYAIRPVKPSELSKCLEQYFEYYKAIETWIEDNKMIDIEYIQHFKLFKDKFLTLLINESIFSNDEIVSSFEYFDIKITAPYTVAIFRIDSFRTHFLEKSQKEKHIVIFKILKIINSTIPNAIAFINLFNEVVVIISGEYKVNVLFEILKDTILKIREDMNLKISCGVGRNYNDPSKIHTSFLEAITSLRYRCIIGYNSVIFIDYVEPENVFTSNYPYGREKILVYTAVIGDYNYCIKILDEIFEQINHFREKFQNILPQIIMSILISISRNAFEQGLNIKPISIFFSTKEVLELKEVSKSYEFLKNGLFGFCEYITKLRKEKSEQLYEDAINYIESNFTLDINYNTISELFKCNKLYFKKIFKEKSGVTLKLYINKLRIKEAKKLIVETNLTDEVIALKIGYDNVSILRQTFKNIEATLITDFRYIRKNANK